MQSDNTDCLISSEALFGSYYSICLLKNKVLPNTPLPVGVTDSIRSPAKSYVQARMLNGTVWGDRAH